MEPQTKMLIQKVVSRAHHLPDPLLREVLDFMDHLEQKEERPIFRGSPAALLHHAGVWAFDPGELEGLLADIAIGRESEEAPRAASPR